MSIRTLPVVHVLDGPQPVYEPPPTDWVRIWDERVERQAKLHCANGHDFSEQWGPVFICGRSESWAGTTIHCSGCQMVQA